MDKLNQVGVHRVDDEVSSSLFEIDGSNNELNGVVSLTQSKVGEVVDMDWDVLLYEYSQDLFKDFFIGESFELAMERDFWDDYVRNLEVLKCEIQDEENNDYEKIVGLIFRKQISKYELSDDIKLRLVSVFSDIFGIDFKNGLEFQSIENFSESGFVAPHNFIFPENMRLNKSDIITMLDFLGAKHVKSDGIREHYIIEFHGENVRYFYNSYYTKKCGERSDHLLIVLKNHPKSLELLSVEDADRICEAYEALGFNVSYK